MKRSVLFFITAFSVSLSGAVHANQYFSNLLRGAWECSGELVDAGVTVKMEGESTYVRNGGSNFFGEISMSISTEDFLRDSAEMTLEEMVALTTFIPETMSFDYFVSTSGTWEIVDGKFLIETTMDAKFTRMSFPEQDIVRNMEDLRKELQLNGMLQTATEIEEFENAKKDLEKGVELFGEVLNLQQSIPSGMSESSEIITLDKENLVVASESTGEKIHCTRKAKVQEQ